MTTKAATKGRPKRDMNQFKVVPNLSLRGKEIMRRLNNRSLRLQSSQANDFSIDTEIDDTRRMNRVDIHRKMLDNSKQAKDLQTKLDNNKIKKP